MKALTIAPPPFIRRQTLATKLRRKSLPPPNGTERRAVLRRRTLLRGRICFGPHHVITVDCGIRNLSEHGAQVRLPPQQALPGEFTLLHINEGLAFDASVIWRRGDLVGLRFTGSHNLKDGADDEFRSLRAIWSALAPA